MVRVDPAPQPRHVGDENPGTVRHYRVWLLVAALLSVAVRVRFVFTPISSDEGGYLAIARAWRHGAELYGEVWVDRPQGLLVVYRLYDLLGLSEDHLRVIGLLFGAVAVVVVGRAVEMVANQRAAVVAAFLVAVLSASPAIEGYAANGELLGGTLSAASLAVGCAVLVGRRSGRWMVVAGILGGIGWSLKQSGIDGPLALAVWLVVAAVAGWTTWRAAIVQVARLLLGVASVVGALALHGALTGWSDWWYAVVGYRASQRSALTGANWGRLSITGWDALRLFGPVIVVALAAGAVAVWHGAHLATTPVGWVFPLWLVAAALTMVSGGQFFHHYWVIVSFPIAALAGLAIGAVPTGRAATLFTCAAAIPALIGAATLAVLPRSEVPLAVSGEARPLLAEQVGEWIDDRARPGDTMFAVCAAAHAYAHADIDPTYRYLWFDGVRQGRGGQARLGELFVGADPPTWVAAFDRPLQCELTGSLATRLDRDYSVEAIVDGVRIYRVDD